MMILTTKRLSQLQGTWGKAVKSKDPQRVLGRAPADNTFKVGASDPILTLSQLRGLRTPSRQIFLDIIYAVLHVFWCTFEADYQQLQKNIIGLRSHVACPDFLISRTKIL